MGNKTISELEVGDTVTTYGITIRVTHVCKSRRARGWYKIQGVDSTGTVKAFEVRGNDRLTR